MAKSLVYKDLTSERLRELQQVSSVDETKELLAKFFQLENHKEDTKNAILLDLYIHILSFATQCDLTPEKTSALFSIVKQMHQQSADGELSLEDTFTLFKQLLVAHSVHRPPYSVQVFTLPELKAITDYMMHTYFRHFKMYSYCFRRRYEMDVKSVGENLEIPPSETQALSAAMDEAEWLKLEAERKAAEEAAAAEKERLRLEEEAAALAAQTVKHGALDMDGPLKEELSKLRAELSTMTDSKFSALESKLNEIEAKLNPPAPKKK